MNNNLKGNSKKYSHFNTKILNKVIYLIILTILIVTIIGSLFHLSIDTNLKLVTNNADNTPFIILSLVCLASIHIPFLCKKLNIEIPNLLESYFILFLFCTIFLGGGLEFYDLIPHWDDFLHLNSGILFGCIGFILVKVLNRNHKTLFFSPIFIALFAFCFAITIGTVWEICEFITDTITNGNNQSYMLEDGTILIGHAAIIDTMKDTMLNTLGAYIAASNGFVSIRHKHGWIFHYIFDKNKHHQS